MILSERLARLLDQSIEEYIKTAVPIASGAICERLEQHSEHRARSPATIRSDLKILEQLGYLHQVHSASGGRVPTAMAYTEYLGRVPILELNDDNSQQLEEDTPPSGKVRRKTDSSVQTNCHDGTGTCSAFAAGLIDDLQQLSHLFAKIERKLAGSGGLPIVRAMEEQLSRKINFQKLFDEPELQMSAIYLIIKEKIDNGKM